MYMEIGKVSVGAEVEVVKRVAVGKYGMGK